MKRVHCLTRLAFVLVVIAAAGCASVTPPPAVTPSPLIGVQLWSVKDEIKRDFEGTLLKLTSLGFQGVEFAGEFGRFREDPKGLRDFLRNKGLLCAGAHVSLAQLSADKFDATTTFYKAASCTDLIIAFEPRAFTVAGSGPVASELTTLSVKLAPLGMRIGYHNHAEEMAGVEGQTAWDVLAQGTPSDVILQQDIGWTHFAGKSPVALIKRYPGRSVSLHYKAKVPKGAGGVPLIGQDGTDWSAVTHAAGGVGGTRWLIVEQEEYPNGMGQLEAVAASMRRLQAVLALIAAR